MIFWENPSSRTPSLVNSFVPAPVFRGSLSGSVCREDFRSPHFALSSDDPIPLVPWLLQLSCRISVDVNISAAFQCLQGARLAVEANAWLRPTKIRLFRPTGFCTQTQRICHSCGVHFWARKSQQQLQHSFALNLLCQRPGGGGRRAETAAGRTLPEERRHVLHTGAFLRHKGGICSCFI